MKRRHSAKRDSKKTRERNEEELRSAIRRRAYELYQQRGCMDGNDLDDWLQAESEVLEPEHKTATG
jgi:hypothetical protein